MPPADAVRLVTALGVVCSLFAWSANQQMLTMVENPEFGGQFVTRLGGAQTFINKGRNGRWRDVLTPEDCERYERRAQAELGEAAAAWLASGRRTDRPALAA